MSACKPPGMHAQISEFKSRIGVDCRETFTKDGAVLPGKKGACSP